MNSITVRIEWDDGYLWYDIDPPNIQQAIVNLCSSNAEVKVTEIKEPSKGLEPKTDKEFPIEDPFHRLRDRIKELEKESRKWHDIAVNRGTILSETSESVEKLQKENAKLKDTICDMKLFP